MHRALSLSAICVAAFLAACAGTANQTQATVDRMYVLYCGEGTAPDQSRWSPGVNVGKPITLSNSCYLIKHGNEWMLDSKWVTHLTASGTFLHSAPWNKQLGVANSSHGCFGMSTSDAKKVYDFLTIGSTVEVKGTSNPNKTEDGNGSLEGRQTKALLVVSS